MLTDLKKKVAAARQAEEGGVDAGDQTVQEAKKATGKVSTYADIRFVHLESTNWDRTAQAKGRSRWSSNEKGKDEWKANGQGR